MEMTDLHTQSSSFITDTAFFRTTRFGDLMGGRGKFGGYAWLGIPYAKPPIGELRWRAPVMSGPWKGVRSALSAGNPACQNIPAYQEKKPDQASYVGDEDCLYLNIWSPEYSPKKGASNRGFPVMVWIHGGANRYGRGDTFDGSQLASSQSVIVVTFNYRLGVFGWFRHSALRDENTTAEDRSGNYGVLDMLCALKWIRENIEVFGGDPANITLFGESGGGTNVYALLTSPLATGLFHRAIVQSGIPITMAPAEAENFVDEHPSGCAQSSGELLLQLLIDDAYAHDRDTAKAYAGRLDRSEIASYLRNKSYDELSRGYEHIVNSGGLQSFPQLFRDGTVLSALDLHKSLQRTDRIPVVPVLLGSTRDEFSLLLPMISGRLLTEKRTDSYGFRIKDKIRYSLIAEYLSLLLKAKSVDEPAELLCINTDAHVFVYRFDWDELVCASHLDHIQPGATHGLDVPFIFGHLKLGPEFFQLSLIHSDSMPSFRRLSKSMMSYWAAFAATGNPGMGRHNELPQWSSWNDSKNDKNNSARYCILFDSRTDEEFPSLSEKIDKAKVIDQLRHDNRLPSDADKIRFIEDLFYIGESFALLGRDDLNAFIASIVSLDPRGCSVPN